MEEIIQEIEISTNDRLVNDNRLLYRMQKTSYSTSTEDDIEQLNENYSYTTRLNSQQRGLSFTFHLTPSPALENENEQDLEIDPAWAEIARISREQWAKENPY